MSKKIHILTYGCQMNDYESDRTYRLFHETKGYEWANTPLDANVVIFNTCSIREKADQKAYSQLGELHKVKSTRSKGDMIIAVGGCMAQVHGKEIQKRFPYVDIVFGTHQWQKLPMLVEQAQEKSNPSTELDLFGWQTYSFLPFSDSTEKYKVSELVTVQNGCDKFCSFCVVPFTRGRQVSRSLEDIIHEVDSLSQAGVKEVTLLGQNVNAYGNDRSSDLNFGILLKKVCEVSGIQRVRFVTSHPSELTFEMIDVMADLPQVCENIHLPVQSGSNRILKLMNRDYQVETYVKQIEYLRKKIPNITISSDFIVAFPTETEVDFQETLKVIKDLQIEESFSFCYSPRPNTKALKLEKDSIEREVGKERLYRLQDLQKENSIKARKAFLNQKAEVLVEGFSKKNPKELTGKIRQNWSVNFEGPESLIGKVLDVNIDEVLTYTFHGDLIQKEFNSIRDREKLPVMHS